MRRWGPITSKRKIAINFDFFSRFKNREFLKFIINPTFSNFKNSDLKNSDLFLYRI